MKRALDPQAAAARRPNGQFGAWAASEPGEIDLTVPFLDEDGAGWRVRGVGAAEAAAWTAAGFTSFSSAGWGRRGFTPDQAREWANLGFAPRVAGDWRDLAFTSTTAATFADFGFDPAGARRWIDDGGPYPPQSAEALDGDVGPSDHADEFIASTDNPYVDLPFNDHPHEVDPGWAEGF